MGLRISGEILRISEEILGLQKKKTLISGVDPRTTTYLRVWTQEPQCTAGCGPKNHSLLAGVDPRTTSSLFGSGPKNHIFTLLGFTTFGLLWLRIFINFGRELAYGSIPGMAMGWRRGLVTFMFKRWVWGSFIFMERGGYLGKGRL